MTDFQTRNRDDEGDESDGDFDEESEGEGEDDLALDVPLPSPKASPVRSQKSATSSPKSPYAPSPNTMSLYAPSPTEPGDWASRTHSRVDHVRSLRMQLTTGKGDDERRQSLKETYASASRPLGKVTAALEDRLKKKIQTEQFLAASLKERMESMTQTIFRVRQSVADLNRASGMHWNAINMAEKRMELRSKRPSDEMIRDALEIALEKERGEQIEAHKRVSVNITPGQEVLVSVMQAQEDMQANILTLHLDRTPGAMKFLNAKRDLEVLADKFCINGSSALREADKISAKAQKRTRKVMEKQIAELRQMRVQLEQEVSQNRIAISNAEGSLDRLGKQIKAYHESPELKITGEAENAFCYSKAQLDFKSLSNLRAKIKGASYTGSSGRQLDVIFGRADRDNSGELDEDEIRRVLRRTLKIPPSAVADPEISALCQTLDADNSGSVSIKEIIDFINADVDIKDLEAQYARNKQLLQELHDAHKQLVKELRDKANACNIDVAVSRVTAVKGLELDTMVVPAKSGDGNGNGNGGAAQSARRKKPLEPRLLEKVRGKLHKATYEVPGRDLKEMLRQFDKDDSGELDDDELRKVLRTLLNVPIYVLSDVEISSLCASLDSDNSGAISISEVVAFIGPPREGEMLGDAPEPIKTVGLAPLVAPTPRGEKGVKPFGSAKSSTGSTVASATPRGGKSQRGESRTPLPSLTK